MPRPWLVVLPLAAIVFAPSYVVAQPSDAKAAAEALFLAGQRLLAEGKVQEACGKFEASEKLDPALGTMLNLATCYERAGRTASAWARFREVTNMAASAGDTRREEYARARATLLEHKLSKLIIAVAPGADVSGLVVRRDGVEVAAAERGLAIPVDPGPHKIEVQAPGRRTWSTTANVEPEGSQSTVTIPMLVADESPTRAAIPDVPRAALPPPAAETLHTGGRTQRTIGVVVGGVGLASIVVGSLFGLAAKSENDDALSHCIGDRCDPMGLEKTDDAKTHASISTIAFVLGGAAVLGGAVLYFTAPKDRVQVNAAVTARGFYFGGAF